MRYPDVFDLPRLYTNNIYVMGQTYGIEAARAAIQKVLFLSEMYVWFLLGLAVSVASCIDPNVCLHSTSTLHL